ncbi:hypothetical protein Fmac_028446 [Flemingia macrophylla]|uniref:Uncharacterized protein n=1 Tax=Flemingia macrophylla TaxID=520843 RepID=A0ABD1L7I1_9FABA
MVHLFGHWRFSAIILVSEPFSSIVCFLCCLCFPFLCPFWCHTVYFLLDLLPYDLLFDPSIYVLLRFMASLIHALNLWFVLAILKFFLPVFFFLFVSLLSFLFEHLVLSLKFHRKCLTILLSRFCLKKTKKKKNKHEENLFTLFLVSHYLKLLFIILGHFILSFIFVMLLVSAYHLCFLLRVQHILFHMHTSFGLLVILFPCAFVSSFSAF